MTHATQTVYLAGGCFWGMEELVQQPTNLCFDRGLYFEVRINYSLYPKPETL